MVTGKVAPALSETGLLTKEKEAEFGKGAGVQFLTCRV